MKKSLLNLKSTKLALNLFFHIFSLLLLVEATYWISGDLIIFNEDFYNKNLYFLYYTLPAITALILTLFLYKTQTHLNNFFTNLILVLINTYGFLCILMLTSEYCDLKKNLDIFFSGVVVIILIVSAFIILKKILPVISIQNIIIVALTTIIAFYDFTVSLIGYQILNPENW